MLRVTRDIAQRFNQIYNREVFTPSNLPASWRRPPRWPGPDGEKMSKSYGNTVEVFEEPKKLRKKLMSIKTDSTPVEELKNPDTCSIFTLFKLFANAEEQEALAARYRAGGMGYGEAKQRSTRRRRRSLPPPGSVGRPWRRISSTCGRSWPRSEAGSGKGPGRPGSGQGGLRSIDPVSSDSVNSDPGIAPQESAASVGEAAACSSRWRWLAAVFLAALVISTGSLRLSRPAGSGWDAGTPPWGGDRRDRGLDGGPAKDFAGPAGGCGPSCT